MFELTLQPGQLTLPQLKQILAEPVKVSLDPACFAGIEAAAKTVADVMIDGRTVYGINTGFGLLANTRIEADELEVLQRSIVLSHAAGVGKLLADSTVRLLMVLKINSLARGFSGVRMQVIDALCCLLEKEVYPCIPAKGSVGASGDLAPLAHMSAPLLGEGEITHKGQRLPASAGLEIAGLAPMVLAPKEGLALLNGTQVSTALAVEGLPPPPLSAHSPLKPPGVRAHLLTCAFTPLAVIHRKSIWRLPTVNCWITPKLKTPTTIVTRCRTPTPCAASPR